MLDLFGSDRPEWGVRETAVRLGISKSKAHEQLTSLAAIGLLRRVPHGRYRLGWRTVAMGALAVETSRLTREAAPAMRFFFCHYRATVQLAAWDRGAVICLARQAPPSAPAFVEVRATAKVFLAAQPWSDVAPIICAGVPATSHHALRAELREAEARGCAWAECDGGGLAVAAGIRDPRAGVIAAMTMFGWQLPGSTADREACSRAIVTAAARISRRLREPEPGAGQRPRAAVVRDIGTGLDPLAGASEDAMRQG